MDKQNRRNFYRILHVQPDAPTEVIKASYRTMMQKLGAHPDRGGDEWTAAIINGAYRILSNPELRCDYDRHLRDNRSEIDPVKRRTSVHPNFRTFNPQADGYRGSMKRCLFCGVQNASVIFGYTDEAHCCNCRSPLARVTAHTRKENERRAVKRVSIRDEFSFYTCWPQASPFIGRVVDLSPLGMRFFATEDLQLNQLIKLEGRGLTAVARVVRCSRRTFDRLDRLNGVQFVTLAIRPQRKTA